MMMAYHDKQGKRSKEKSIGRGIEGKTSREWRRWRGREGEGEGDGEAEKER
jgi:hypothetical protein